MRRGWWLAWVLVIGCCRWVAGDAPGTAAAAAPADAPAAPVADVSQVLSEAIESHDIPGMTAAVIEGDRVVATGAAGVRQRGGREKVTVADKFHLGSCTKTMTATLCAMLVEDRKLRWDSTVASIFPDAKKLHPDYRRVTLEQLLNHRGGAPANVEPPLWNSLWEAKGVQARRKLLDTVFALPPQARPGTQYVYSNFGYALAGHMAETAARKPWEDLMRERLFVPLGMSSAGFGAPVDRGATHQPRGHTAEGKPVEPAQKGSDNPAAIGPGATAHCSVGDWAKFISLHLQGARGRPKLLKAETFKKLHTPPDGSPYAMGWLVGPSPLGEGSALSHAGSNTMWYAVAWVLPKQNLAVVVMCNQGGPGSPGEKACDEVSGRLIREQAARRPAR